PPDLSAFPTRRSSDLMPPSWTVTSVNWPPTKTSAASFSETRHATPVDQTAQALRHPRTGLAGRLAEPARRRVPARVLTLCRSARDRKSTRLNSSHVKI